MNDEHDNYYHKLNERLFRCENAKEDARTEYDLGHVPLSVLNNRLKEFDIQIGAIEAELQALSFWEALYRDESMPFARPESGQIPVKVINHYGDEVLKVYKV